MIHKKLEWSDSLLANGASKTQKQWKEFLKESKWRLPKVKEYESLRGCKDAAFMSSLKNDLIKYWLYTDNVLKNPFNNEERPVLLGLLVDDDWFVIDADFGDDSRPARGVAVVKKKVVRKKA